MFKGRWSLNDESVKGKNLRTKTMLMKIDPFTKKIRTKNSLNNIQEVLFTLRWYILFSSVLIGNTFINYWILKESKSNKHLKKVFLTTLLTQSCSSTLEGQLKSACVIAFLYTTHMQWYRLSFGQMYVFLFFESFLDQKNLDKKLLQKEN